MLEKTPGTWDYKLQGDDLLNIAIKNLYMITVVNWYTKISGVLLTLNIALTSFDAVELYHGAIDLCPPGLGRVRFVHMGASIFTVVSNNLTRDLHELALWINVIENNGRNGYHLLYQVFKACIPSFSEIIVFGHP